MIARPDGLTSCRETGDDGATVYVVDEAATEKRLVTHVAGDKLPFGGKWTYVLTANGTETQLRIAENGEVYNPVFRFVSRFVSGIMRQS